MRSKALVSLAFLVCACSQAREGSDAARALGSKAVAAANSVVVAATAPPAAVEHAAVPKESPSVPASQLRCGTRNPNVIKDTGIGDLEVGSTTGMVKRSCNVIRDMGEPGNEGMTERMLRVVLGGEVIRASVDGDIINRITIDSPRYATPDGLRVGTPLSRVVSQKGVKPEEGEDALYLLVPSHCGLSFRFKVPSRTPGQQQWKPAQLAARHGNATVNRILVTRCVR